MKLEKINDNKIQIFFTIDDLIEKKIDLHSFMSNSIESQELFLDVLNQAEKQLGFSTQDSQIKVEVLAINKNNFVLTLTKFDIAPAPSVVKKRQLYYKRKKFNFEKNESLYRFNNFDDFYTFCNIIQKISNVLPQSIAKEINLYSYQNQYFLILNNINFECSYSKLFFTTLCEFSNYIDNSDLLIHKLYEYGDKMLDNSSMIALMKE